jgi:hypothetical protein
MPSKNADPADANGIPKARQTTAKLASTPYSAAYGAEMPRWRTPLASRCGCSAMK